MGEAKRKIAGSRREKVGKQTYAARVLGDLKLVKENRDLKGVKSEVTGDMKRRLGEKVKQLTEYNEDDSKRLKIKRKLRPDSPIKPKSPNRPNLIRSLPNGLWNLMMKVRMMKSIRI